MSTLHLHLLGGFSARIDDQPLTRFHSAKSRALLAYLALQPDVEHPRSALAALFWGDMPETAARTNLRVELSKLKKSVREVPLLEVNRQTVRCAGTAVQVDAHRFREEVSAWLALPQEMQLAQLAGPERAVARYQSDFLAGFYLPDAPDFADWQRQTQEQLFALMMRALDIMQQCYAAQGSWPALAAAAQRQLTLTPWLEAAHRNLIQALAAQGRTQQALAQYETCCAVLREELGVDPAPETAALAARLRDGRPAPRPPAHNLPSQLQTFVGRERETAALRELLNQHRLVTLLGIGGVGKSRLAQQVARAALTDFADGVWFVSLAAIPAGADAAARIALAIAAAVAFPITRTEAALVELQAYLADKKMLLVLDNWEHLIAAAEQVVGGLTAETGLRLLATSRQRLGMPDERVFPLEGLPEAEAVALFSERARQLLPDFALSAENQSIQTEIAGVCRQVGGLPLGIELAASWVEHFSVAEIRQSLAYQQAEPLQAEGLVDRHRSLDKVLTYSWDLLSEAQQRILARVSLFRGGFDRAAATAVADSTLSDLSQLIAHSLIQRVGPGRYDLHPLVGEYAARRLAARMDAAETAALHARYSTFFLTGLNERMQSPADLRTDYENITRAWRLAVRSGAAALIATALVDFKELVLRFGLMGDGQQWFQEAVEQFEDDEARRELVAQLLFQQWIFTRAVLGQQAMRGVLKRVAALSEDVHILVPAMTDLANLYAEDGLWAEAEQYFDRVETLAQQADDPHLYINAVEGRIQIYALHFRGDFAAGLTRLESLLPLLDAIPDPTRETHYLRGHLLSSLATVGFRYGAYDRALRYAQENVKLVDTLADRMELVASLLELALCEMFAGMFPEAIAHNREALALAEEIGAADDCGLLQANICMTLRQSGDLDEAVRYGETAVTLLRELKLTRMLGQALNRLGHTQLAQGRAAAAYATYREALRVWAPLDHPNEYEARAGLAVAALQAEKKEEGAAAADRVQTFINTHDLMLVVEPALLFLHLAQAQAELEQREAARRTVDQGLEWVDRIAGRINDAAVRESFRRRPDNRRLAERRRELDGAAG